MLAKRSDLQPLMESKTAELSPPGSYAKFHILALGEHWTAVLSPASRPQLEAVLVEWLRGQRWFGGKARTVTSATIKDSIPIPCGPDTALFNLVRVEYLPGEPELYALPLAFAQGKEAESLRQLAPRFIVCELTLPATGQSGVLHGGITNNDFCSSFLEFISSGRRIRSATGELVASHAPLFRQILGEAVLPEPVPGKAEQSNSSIIYGEKFILKLFRRLDVGINPDFEVTRFLTARMFPYAQQLAGTLEFCRPSGERLTLGMLNRFLPGAKDAWAYTLGELDRYYERVAALIADRRVPAPTGEPHANGAQNELPLTLSEVLGAYLNSARLLATRTAEMHLALASDTEDPAFAPEPFSPAYFRGVVETMHHQVEQNFGLLRNQLPTLAPDILPLAQKVLELEPRIISRFRLLYERRIAAQRIRCHGDYHLGQVLSTGGDFVIIDFEGEPALPLPERRIKRSPLRDVAGMVRSFDYAAWAGLHEYLQRRCLGPETSPKLEPWLRMWHQAVSSAFVCAYRETMGESGVVPHSDHELSAMLPAYLLNKAVYEVGYELNNRPAWLRIPLVGILEMFQPEALT